MNLVPPCATRASFILFFSFLSVLFIQPHLSHADVVKPALIEISAYTTGKLKIEIRASVEALLTGINARYKNTKDAPNAKKYDLYRHMNPKELGAVFKDFEPRLLKAVFLKVDGKKVKLHVSKTHIPPKGYTKVPRISVITLTGIFPSSAQSLDFTYPIKFSDSAIRVRQVDEAAQKWHWSSWQYIRKGNDPKPFSLEELFKKPSTFSVIKNYLIAGFEHILPKGVDHILFILGIFLFAAKLSPLLWQVTMFTLAHTITLGLAMSGYISLPARIVEPLIALSIAYVGIENLFHRKLRNSRLALVFGFGLLHGLGFASVLSDFGMPSHAFMTALVSFNIGVEFGQLTILATAWFSVAYWLRNKPDIYRKYVIIPGSLLISIIALYWFVERLDFF